MAGRVGWCACGAERLFTAKSGKHAKKHLSAQRAKRTATEAFGLGFLGG